MCEVLYQDLACTDYYTSVGRSSVPAMRGCGRRARPDRQRGLVWSDIGVRDAIKAMCSRCTALCLLGDAGGPKCCRLLHRASPGS